MGSRKRPKSLPQGIDNISACFMSNAKGKVCIALSDPEYVRAEKIIFDRQDRSVHAVLHETSHLLGHVSKDMAEVLVDNDEVLLCAVHTNGGIIELTSQLAVSKAH
jgi:nitrite reductase/ring-hydroxylating ferredoxin subunit